MSDEARVRSTKRSFVPYKTFCPKCGANRVDAQIGIEPTLDAYVETMVAVGRDLWRVLKPEGTFWLNLGDSYASKPVGTFNGGGFKDSSAVSGGRDLSGVATSGVMDKVAGSALKPKDLCGVPWRVAFALQADGWWLRSAIVWAKPNPMPESVTDRPTSAYEMVFLLTKAERYFYDAEAIAEPCESGESDLRKMREQLPRMGGKHKDLVDPLSNASSATNIGRKRSVGSGVTRNARNVWTIATQPFKGSHFATMPPELAERCIKAGSSERGCCPHCGKPWERMQERVGANGERVTVRASDRTAANPDGSPIMGDNAYTQDELVRAGFSAKTGVVKKTSAGWSPSCACPMHEPIPARVLDPFGGAGTTGLVADRLGRHATLIELNPEYREMSHGRLCEDRGPLFAEPAE